MPGLFALSTHVLHSPQLATFAAFGSFATLVLANFGGSRWDKLVGHAELAVVGSMLVVVGTAVSSSTAAAAVVTLVVAFFVLFAGISGPNAASGATAAMLAYVLPAASPGTMSMVPDRLAGWWLASAVGTLAVLTLAPRAVADRLRVTTAATAAALAEQLEAALAGRPLHDLGEASRKAKQEMLTAFTVAPYRPTGLAVADQALGNLIETLQWCSVLVFEAVREGSELTTIDQTNWRLFRQAATVLSDTAGVLRGAEVRPNLGALEELAAASSARVADLGDDTRGDQEEVHVAFHAQTVAAAVRSAAADALIATRRAGPAVVVAERTRWGDTPSGSPVTDLPIFSDRLNLVSTARRLARGHASLRSVWFLNSARGAVALACAVAVAKFTNVQHGFWVVLGTLSVLRTSAGSTGATALRALGGTATGFFIGAGLILAIGSHPAALWVALPLAVAVAAYAPGTAPFVVGQAAFTVTLSVLYNIIVPVGWKVGAVRLEDVAIGAGVSVVVGVLFWPRGASSVLRDDLADAFHRGGEFLVQATAFALGLREASPEAAVLASRASVRLDDALRAMLTEQGSKRVPKEELWRLVGGTARLRLTAQSLAASRPPVRPPRRSTAPWWSRLYRSPASATS